MSVEVHAPSPHDAAAVFEAAAQARARCLAGEGPVFLVCVAIFGVSMLVFGLSIFAVRYALGVLFGVVPALKASGNASVVLFSTVAVAQGFTAHASIAMAKGAVEGLVLALAAELAPKVRVNAIAPGPILWPDDESFDELSRQRIISHTPLKREGEPDDIAKAVHFLLADAGYVTGETINVDGGRHVAI